MFGFIIRKKTNKEKFNTIPECTYTGEWSGIQADKNAMGEFIAKFYTSGTLTFSKINSAKKIDICVVGGGDDGQRAYNDGTLHGGLGGFGGEVKNIKNYRCADKVNIVIGGANENTSFNEIESAHGVNVEAVRAFNEIQYLSYGKKGANGIQLSNITQGVDGASGDKNSGEGGGGARWCYYNGTTQIGKPGRGGSGIILIRNARSNGKILYDQGTEFILWDPELNATKRENEIYLLTKTSNYGGISKSFICSNVPIDLTDYKTINIGYHAFGGSVYKKHRFFCNVATSPGGSINKYGMTATSVLLGQENEKKSVGTLKLNVSELKGSYYLYIGLINDSEGGEGTFSTHISIDRIEIY